MFARRDHERLHRLDRDAVALQLVRDQLGGVGVGYSVVAYNTPANPVDREVVARTISNRAGGAYEPALR